MKGRLGLYKKLFYPEPWCSTPKIAEKFFNYTTDKTLGNVGFQSLKRNEHILFQRNIIQYRKKIDIDKTFKF